MAQKRYLTAVFVCQGVIRLINELGRVEDYRQRGIENLSEVELVSAVNNGCLVRNWRSLPELPKNISPSYETKEMGRLYVTYNLQREMEAKNKRK